MEQFDFLEGVISGNVSALSRAITLVESNKPEHRKQALELVAKCSNQKRTSIRVGITGIPGVGKSTFIEQLGLHVLSQGYKLAVLAVDPSSGKSAGSILGDKTRMENLSKEPNAFIRPSPSGGTLGGVALRTRESMILCEAAGYDVVFVETVGVGQSETELLNITDTFLMLAMPGTGDELQGIKRGIMEAADIIVINKADGNNLLAARQAKKQLDMALHLYPLDDSGWAPKVQLASALKKEGIMACWNEIENHHRSIKENGWLAKHRKRQQLKAFQRMVELNLVSALLSRFGKQLSFDAWEEKLASGLINEYDAAAEIIGEAERLF